VEFGLVLNFLQLELNLVLELDLLKINIFGEKIGTKVIASEPL
jgi:hypothetical protein